jgi:drug/metabolite transporter (DMT)-like permease
MNHPTYLVVGILAATAAVAVAVRLRGSLMKLEDSPATKKWFGWFVGGLGVLCVLAYYATDNPSPDNLAVGWALAVFGGYTVESGRLRERINKLEAKLSSFDTTHCSHA